MSEVLTWNTACAVVAVAAFALNLWAFMRAKRGAATGTRRGLWLRLKGLLTRQEQAAGGGSKDARGDSRPLKWLGGGSHVVRLEPPLFLAEPFALLLDFDALEREAEQARQEATRQPTAPRKPKGLREFLKPDVTRTEELLLTAELSRLGSCDVARPGFFDSDRQGRGAGCLRFLRRGSGFEVAFA